MKDPHSYSRPNQAVVKHLDWEAVVDFEAKNIKGIARLDIEFRGESREVVLDAKNLQIDKVTAGDDEDAIIFKLGPEDTHMGQALEISVPDGKTRVNVYYQTTSGAEALQWLDPVQTSGGQAPFLFTQSQAILARTWIPIQDSPGIRFTYSATVKVPSDLLALMSAVNPTQKNETGVYQFKMDQPIPAYLLALAVGDVVFHPIGDRTGVYAEPAIIEKAAYEFEEMDEMLETAEKLYGPYRWERYDIIVLPPSFPFGGMENPRLTFATPTILAGDRSLTSLVAHELAHSWSGNLVTNATWNDFWLNEGFTVYFENRIMEALYGRSYSEMLASLSKQDLIKEIDQFTKEGKSKETRLKLDLAGTNPDDGVTSIAYDKGYLFLRYLEELAGREQFDEFLKTYFETHAFQVMTTENFISYLQVNFLEKYNIQKDEKFVDQWIYGEGLPADAPEPVSNRFDLVDDAVENWVSGTEPGSLSTQDWTTHEWIHFIRALPDGITMDQMKGLDDSFGFTHSANSEILVAWLIHVIKNQYEPGYPSLEKFLINTGRRKFLVPLYEELIKSPQGKMLANNIYQKARPNYHFVSTNSIDEILK